MDREERPLEHAIGMSFWRFLQAFWNSNHNHLKAPIFLNPIFYRGIGDNGKVDTRTLDSTVIGKKCFEDNAEAWLSLKLCDLLDNNVMVSMNTLIARLGFTITVNTYMALRRAISHALVRYRLRVDSDGSSIGINEFLSRKTKGAKKFRKIINKQGAPNKMLEKQNATALVNKFTKICTLYFNCFTANCIKIG